MNARYPLSWAMVALVGCGGAVPETHSTPRVIAARTEAPRSAPSPIVIPEPEPGRSPRVLRASTLRVAMRLPLGPVERAANAAAPTVLAEDGRGGRFLRPGYRYRVTRGPIRVTGSGEAIEWTVPVHLEGSADVVGGCVADLTAALSTQVRITPDWRLRASSRRGALEWQRRCRVLLGVIDLSGAIEPRVRDAQDSMARTIDEGLASRDLRAAFTALWSELARPIALPEDFGLWLRPSRLGISELRASPGALEATVEVGVRPIAAREAPGDAEPAPLPTNSSSETAERDFTLYTDVEIPLARIAAELERGARAHLAALGVELASIRAVGGRDAIYVGFELARPAGITAWFGAVVSVDTERRAMRVSNVRATPETREALARLGIDTALVERLFRPDLSVPVAEHVEAIAAGYRAAVSSPLRVDERAELRVAAGPVELVDTYHTPTDIGFVIAISGSAELVVSADLLSPAP